MQHLAFLLSSEAEWADLDTIATTRVSGSNPRLAEWDQQKTFMRMHLPAQVETLSEMYQKARLVVFVASKIWLIFWCVLGLVLRCLPLFTFVHSTYRIAFLFQVFLVLHSPSFVFVPCLHDY